MTLRSLASLASVAATCLGVVVLGLAVAAAPVARVAPVGSGAAAAAAAVAPGSYLAVVDRLIRVGVLDDPSLLPKSEAAGGGVQVNINVEFE